MKLSDYIVKFLKKRGIRHVFGFIGGAITHLVDSFYKDDSVKFIQVYHEQTAAISAEGYSRNSDKTGVALATSGPGATNLITGIADAYYDSIPAVFITGQVNTYEQKADRPVRQLGFQEADIIDMAKPITKLAIMVDRPEKIRFFLEKAFYIANEGRPGPVLLDIPMDIQRAEIDENSLKCYSPSISKKFIRSDEIEKIVNLINNSKRPLILAGGGISSSGAEKALLSFSKKNKIPVVTSLMGKGCFPEDNELFVGMIGSYGNRCANIVMANSDLLIAAGSRLDSRQTGTAPGTFIREGKIIQIDIDENEIENTRIHSEVKLPYDVKDVIEKLMLSLEWSPDVKWIQYIKKVKSVFSQDWEIEKNALNRLPYQIMKILNRFSEDDRIFCVDVGQNQMFAAQTLRIREKQKFFTSGGLAPMGYSIPIAIGASFACNHSKNIFAITGDGGFHISTQSLMLLSQYDLPIKVIILNNRSLGMLSQFQDLYFNKKMAATTAKSGYRVPEIKHISKAYGLDYFLVDKNNIGDMEYIKSILIRRGPAIIEVLTGEKTVVVPKLEVNRPVEDTSPRLEKELLKKYMLIDPV